MKCEIRKNLHNMLSLILVIICQNVFAQEDDRDNYAGLAFEVVQFLLAHKASDARNVFSSELADEVSEDELKELLEYFPLHSVYDIRAAKYAVSNIGGKEAHAHTFIVHTENDGYKIIIGISSYGAKPEVAGFHFEKYKKSGIPESNDNTGIRLSISKIMIIVLAIIIPFFSFITMIHCLRNRGGKMLIFWLPFIGVGIGTVSVNLYSGNLELYPLYVLLLSVGLHKATNSEVWTVAVAVPWGAMCYWVSYWKQRLNK